MGWRFWIGFACVVLMLVGTQAVAGSRPWTVRDSVALRHFVTYWIHPGSARGLDDPVQYSPDGRHLFFVSWHGDLASDQTVYELWVYSVPDLQSRMQEGVVEAGQGVEPFRRLVMRSGRFSLDGSAAIFAPYWESDSMIAFVGIEGSGPRRGYLYDVEANRLTPITDQRHSLGETGGGELYLGGGSVMYFTYEGQADVPQHYPFAIVDSELLYNLSGRAGPGEKSAARWRLNASLHGGPSRVVAEGRLNLRGGAYMGFPAISPDGRWAVSIYRPDRWDQPPEWQGYGFRTNDLRVMLLDLASGVERAIIDTPLGTSPVVPPAMGPPSRFTSVYPAASFWSADSRHILIVNGTRPLDPRTPANRTTSYVLSHDRVTGETRVVEPMATGEGVQAVAAWIEAGQRLRITYQRGRTVLRTRDYVASHSGWNAVAPVGAPPAGVQPAVEVVLRQGPNQPPQMIARADGAELRLTPDDPALDGVDRIPEQVFEWTAPDGSPATAALLLPRSSSRTGSPPLVVQFANTETDGFAPDGLAGTADAAQLLTARGFAVLKLPAAGGYGTGQGTREEFQTPREFPSQVAHVDAAVAALRARGLVNDQPIGLTGFSRTGAYAYYVATHPGTTRIGAAIAFDSITNGLGEYFAAAGIWGTRQTALFDSQFGNGHPFWENREGWLDAPDLNLDRLEAPMLFHITTNPATLRARETIGAFALAQRPIEYRSYVGAGHSLTAPKQRLAALQSTVDWMDFWLRGHERSDPDAAEQYRRWRDMRERREQTRVANKP